MRHSQIQTFYLPNYIKVLFVEVYIKKLGGGKVNYLKKDFLINNTLTNGVD